MTRWDRLRSIRAWIASDQGVTWSFSDNPADPCRLLIPASLPPRALFLTRPSLAHYTLDRAELLQRANDLFTWTASGKLKLRMEKTFRMAEAAEAHRQLEGRKTTGKVILLP